MSIRRNGFWGNVHSAKCPSAKYPFGEMSFDEMAFGEMTGYHKNVVICN
jgi:hypothetical protein